MHISADIITTAFAKAGAFESEFEALQSVPGKQASEGLTAAHEVAVKIVKISEDYFSNFKKEPMDVLSEMQTLRMDVLDRGLEEIQSFNVGGIKAPVVMVPTRRLEM